MQLNRNITRRKFLKLGSYLLGGLLASPFAGYSYSRYMEPRMVRIHHISLTLPRLPAAFHGTRLVQFSDIHLDFHYGVGRLRRLVDQLQRLQPDILCFTGDLYDTDVGTNGEAVAKQLARLKPPLGKWAVLGNHDYIAGKSDVERVLEQGGFSILTNRAARIEREGAAIRMAGIDDVLWGQPSLSTALQYTTEDMFTILLAHEPDYADTAIRFPIDLQLSGHSHGGQVRIPFYGSLFTPELARKYPDGLYVLEHGKLHVYTNRGIGVSTHPIRFWCRPEVTVFTLE